MTLRSFLPALLVLLVLGAGCTADPATETTILTPQTDVPLIAPEALAEFVPPAPSGWRLLAPPAPATLEEDGASLVSVTASYLPDSDPNGTGTRSADLVVQDTGGRSAGLLRLVDPVPAGPVNGTDPVRTTLRGKPAIVVRDPQMTRAYLVVEERYVVYLTVTGRVPGDFDAFVAALDLEGLSGLR